MSGGEQALSGPDFRQGVSVAELADGAMQLGHVDGEAVVLARRGDQLFAIGATCTHYGGPLAEGLMVGDTVRCPWHHACFSLRTGEALHAPALNPLACWRVERFSGPQIEAGMMPGAPHRLADHQPFGEWAAVMGARRTDGEQLVAAPREDDRLAVDVAELHRAVRELRDRHTLPEVRPREGLLSPAHPHAPDGDEILLEAEGKGKRNGE